MASSPARYLPAALVLRSPPPLATATSAGWQDSSAMSLPQRPRAQEPSRGPPPPMSQSAVAVISEELDTAQRTIQTLEHDRVNQIKEASTMRLEEERKRLALRSTFENELALAEDRHKLKLQALQDAHGKDLDAERRRASEARSRLQEAEQLVEELHATVAQFAAATQKAELRADAAEALEAKTKNDAAHAAKSLHGQIEGLHLALDRKGEELDAERAKTNATLRAVDDAKVQHHEALRQLASLERQLGELQVASNRAHDDAAALSKELEAMRVRAAEEAEASLARVQVKQDECLLREGEAMRARDEIRARNSQIGQLEASLAECRDSIATLERKLSRVQEDKANALARLDAEKTNSASLVEKLQQLESRAASETVSRASAEAKNRDLDNERAQLQGQLHREQQSNEMLRAEVTDLNLKMRRIPFLEEQLAANQSALDRATVDSSAYERRLSEQRSQISALEQALGESRTAANVSRELECELSLLKDRLGERVKLSDRLRAEIDAAQRDMERQHDEARLRDAENASLRNEVESLRTCRDELDAERARKAVLEGRLAKSEQSIAARIAEHTSLVNTHEAVMRRLAECEAQLAVVPTLRRRLEQEEAETAVLRQTQVASNERLRDLQDELSKAATQAEKEATAVHKMQQDLAGLESQLAEARAQIRDAGATAKLCNERGSEIHRLESDLKAAEAKSVSFATEKQALASQITLSEEQRAALKRTIAELNKAVEELQIELGRRLVSVETAEKALLRASDDLRHATQEAQSLREALSAARSEVAAVARDRDSHRERHQTVCLELERATREIVSMEQRWEEAEKHAIASEAREHTLCTEINDLRGAYTKSTVLEGKIAALQRLAEEKASEISAANQVIAVLRREVEDLQSASASYARAEERVRTQRTEIQRMRDELDAADSRRMTLDAAIAEKERALRDAVAEIVHLKAGHEELLAEVALRDRRIDALEIISREKARLDGTCSAQQQLLAARDNEIESLTQEAASLKQQCSMLTTELNSVTSLRTRITELERQLEERLKSAQQLELDAQRRCAVSSQMQAALSESEAARDALSASLREAQQLRDTLESRVTMLTDRLNDVEASADATERSCVMESNKLHAYAYENKVELDKAQSTLAALTKQLRDSEDVSEKQRERIADLDRKVGSLEAEVERCSKLAMERQQDCVKLSGMVQAEKKRASEAAAERETAEVECEAALESLRKANASASADESRLERQLTEARLESQRARHDLKLLQDELTRYRSDAHHHGDVLAEANREVARRTQQVHELELTVAQLRTAVDEANDARSSAELNATELEILLARSSTANQSASRSQQLRRVVSPPRGVIGASHGRLSSMSTQRHAD